MTTENSWPFIQFLRLHDGTLIDPRTREAINSRPIGQIREEEADEEELNAELESSSLELAPLERSSIMDLPLPARQMVLVNNVLVLTVYGLPLDEIALACNVTVDAVVQVQKHDAYRTMMEALTESLRRSYVSTVQGVLQDTAVTAAKTVRHLVKKSKSPDLRFQASKDVLDRTGHRAADRVEHMHSIKQEDELVIRIIRDADTKQLPTIDAEVIDA